MSFLKRHSVLPGFGLSMGFTLTYLGLLVLLPLAAMILKASELDRQAFLHILLDPRIIAAFRVSLWTSAAAAAVNMVFGSMLAWVLVRYEFPGRRFCDAMVDLPFALPTAVSGITLTALFAPTGWLGVWFERVGVQVVFTPLGIVVALVFISLPFVVRTLQPALEDLDPELEEAAASLGAGRWQALVRVIAPVLLPALLTGFALAFARALGEYGSVIFISGNMPMKTEIVPLSIIMKLEQFDVAGATAIATVMLAFSFVLLLAINILQSWSASRHAG
ncbi:MAG: sulfate ABC transporter permease subunit CysT [Elusimicrobiota bacterium]